ncbi:hypothetical protein BKI52_31130 [marine bacterium AO1-C]|nr:hypothetical protein BKI52_31130 [marine bacterium AO1-C]
MAISRKDKEDSKPAYQVVYALSMFLNTLCLCFFLGLRKNTFYLCYKINLKDKTLLQSKMKESKNAGGVQFQVQVPAGFVIWLFRKQQSVHQTLASMQCQASNFHRISDKSFYFEVTGARFTNSFVGLIRSILFQHLPTNLHPATQDFISIQIKKRY